MQASWCAELIVTLWQVWMNLTSLLTAEFAWTMCLVRLDKMHDKCILRLPPSSFIPWSIRCSLGRVQSSHLLGHFTSNCCGCLDTRLMMQPGLEIILMSLLIRKNSKIANFHCPYNTKYTQKYQFIQILLLVKNICQDWSSKFFSPTVRSQENTFIIKSFPAFAQYLWHQALPTAVAWPRDEGLVLVRTHKCNSGGFMRRPGSGGSGGSVCHSAPHNCHSL